MTRSITSKAEGIALFKRGAFGNTIRQWDSPATAIAAGYTGSLVVRSTRPASPYCRYGIGHAAAEALIAEAVAAGYRPDEMYVNEFVDDDPSVVRILQGEVCRGPGGLWLNYTTLDLPMRPALAQGGRHAYGLQAKMLLQSHLDPGSYDELMDLLDTFDDCTNRGMPTSHVVEFSCWGQWIGDVPGRNSILWETRAY
jgi:hypothetical protein